MTSCMLPWMTSLFKLGMFLRKEFVPRGAKSLKIYLTENGGKQCNKPKIL